MENPLSESDGEDNETSSSPSENEEEDHVLLSENEEDDHVLPSENEEDDHVLPSENEEEDHVLLSDNKQITPFEFDMKERKAETIEHIFNNETDDKDVLFLFRKSIEKYRENLVYVKLNMQKERGELSLKDSEELIDLIQSIQHLEHFEAENIKLHRDTRKGSLFREGTELRTLIIPFCFQGFSFENNLSVIECLNIQGHVIDVKIVEKNFPKHELILGDEECFLQQEKLTLPPCKLRKLHACHKNLRIDNINNLVPDELQKLHLKDMPIEANNFLKKGTLPSSLYRVEFPSNLTPIDDIVPKNTEFPHITEVDFSLCFVASGEAFQQFPSLRCLNLSYCHIFFPTRFIEDFNKFTDTTPLQTMELDHVECANMGKLLRGLQDKKIFPKLQNIYIRSVSNLKYNDLGMDKKDPAYHHEKGYVSIHLNLNSLSGFDEKQIQVLREHFPRFILPEENKPEYTVGGIPIQPSTEHDIKFSKHFLQILLNTPRQG